MTTMFITHDTDGALKWILNASIFYSLKKYFYYFCLHGGIFRFSFKLFLTFVLNPLIENRCICFFHIFSVLISRKQVYFVNLKLS